MPAARRLWDSCIVLGYLAGYEDLKPDCPQIIQQAERDELEIIVSEMAKVEGVKIMECIHHWLLNNENYGICQRCHRERQFPRTLKEQLRPGAYLAKIPTASMVYEKDVYYGGRNSYD